MKLSEFIAELSKYNQDADVFVATKNGDGCDTCGWGETSSEHDIKLVDLETKIVIEAD